MQLVKRKLQFIPVHRYVIKIKWTVATKTKNNLSHFLFFSGQMKNLVFVINQKETPLFDSLTVKKLILDFIVYVHLMFAMKLYQFLWF